MGISLDKWLVMGALAVISFGLGILPYFIIHRTRMTLRTDSKTYKLVLTILSCFGGGVLLATSSLHMLPEVRESLAQIETVWETFDTHFPAAEALMLLGFGLIYFVEEIAHFIMVEGHNHHHHHHHDSVARHNSIAHAIPLPETHRPSLCGSECDNNTLQGVSVDKLEDSSSDKSKEEEESQDHQFTSSLRSFLALIALSFHAIMEGVAIGIQNSSDMWLLFGAVASHKFVISFCMGMELVSSNSGIRTYTLSILTFAVVSPLGILIGSAFTSGDTENLPVTIIEGLATGTLLYVVFFEILNRERERKTYSMQNSRAVGFIQFAALAVGLIAMGCLLTLTGHEHGHSEEDHEDCHDHGHFQIKLGFDTASYGQDIFSKVIATKATSPTNLMKMPVAFGR